MYLDAHAIRYTVVAVHGQSVVCLLVGFLSGQKLTDFKYRGCWREGSLPVMYESSGMLGTIYKLQGEKGKQEELFQTPNCGTISPGMGLPASSCCHKVKCWCRFCAHPTDVVSERSADLFRCGCGACPDLLDYCDGALDLYNLSHHKK